MSLSHDLDRIRQQSVDALDDAFDYHQHTKFVWRLMQRAVEDGRLISIQNLSTRTTVDGAELTRRAQRYATTYLASATLQQFVAVFERTWFDLLHRWLKRFPEQLGSKQVAFRDVLAAADKDTITDMVIDQKLHNLSYRRLSEWVSAADEMVGPSLLPEAQVVRIAEIKASRDAHVHSNGIAGPQYLDKAGSAARAKRGERLDISDAYLEQAWRSIRDAIEHSAGVYCGKAPD